MKRLISVFICLLFLWPFSSSLSEEESASIRAIIDGGNSDRVHLRAAPSVDANSLGLYFTGTDILCNSTPAEAWTRVLIGSQDGYMKSEYIRWGDDAKKVQSKQPMGVVHTSSWVNVRNSPTKDGNPEGKLYHGDTVAILGETATHWYYVSTRDTIGYVMAEYIALEEAADAPNAYVPIVSQDKHILAQYKHVLDNDLEFYNTSSNRNMYLGQLNYGFDGLSVVFKQFAAIDLDADGIVEVIVKLAVNDNDYGYELLDYRDGVVYGYDMVYRAFMDLKVDGTFSYASSAADTGFGTLTFHQNGYTVHPIASSEATDSGGANYYHSGVAITDASYMQLVNGQASKQNADWFDFTNAMIEKSLGK